MSRPQPSRSTPAPTRWPAVLAWAPTAPGLVVIVWLDVLIRQAGSPELHLLAEFGPLLVALLSAATVGMVLATRQPRHPVGWLLLVFGSTGVVAIALEGYAHYALLVRPGELPAGSVVAMLSFVSFASMLVSLGYILLLTPTGSLPSPRWRWWARVAAAAAGVWLLAGLFGTPVRSLMKQPVPSPLAVDALAGPLDGAGAIASIVVNIAVLIGAASLVVRLRHARGLERQQLRWVVLALVPAPVVALGAVAIDLGVLPVEPGFLFGPFLALVFLAIGAAAARYRLYDLDRIVSRTLAYGLLTMLLGLGYAVVVLGLGPVLGGEGSSLVVAGATLAVAAVFQPARRRIQDLVDRRFNRRRYDAERTIAAFSGRLRQQTDLDALTAELLAVVDQTMQPTRAALWLRPVGRQSTHGAGRAGGATNALA